MIHPGDVILYHDTGVEYKVTQVGPSDLQCCTLELDPHYMYPEINADTLEILDDSKWGLVTCPHAAPAPVTSEHAEGRTERYIRAASAMEYRLGDVYVQIRSALVSLDAERHETVRNRLTVALASIERTSSRLLEVSRPEDSIQWDSIHRVITETK